LTRRANHRQNDIIARTSKPAPETAAGFFNFLNRTAAARRGATSPQAPCLSVASAPPSEPYICTSSFSENRCTLFRMMRGISRRARTRRHAARHESRVRTRPLGFEGYGFAPEMIAALRSCRTFFIRKRAADDRLSDLACTGRPDRDRGLGRIFMSAEIISRCANTRSRCGGRTT
jgi:hypothetical protein